MLQKEFSKPYSLATGSIKAHCEVSVAVSRALLVEGRLP